MSMSMLSRRAFAPDAGLAALAVELGLHYETLDELSLIQAHNLLHDSVCGSATALARSTSAPW